MTYTIERFNPPSLFDASESNHSQVTTVEAGRLAFFSGQVAWTPEGTRAPRSLSDQTKVIMGHLRAGLEAIGSVPSDIVMMRIYVVNLTPDRTAEVFPHLRAFLGDVHPSMTGIGVQALAGPDLEIEVEMIARVPS